MEDHPIFRLNINTILKFVDGCYQTEALTLPPILTDIPTINKDRISIFPNHTIIDGQFYCNKTGKVNDKIPKQISFSTHLRSIDNLYAYFNGKWINTDTLETITGDEYTIKYCRIDLLNIPERNNTVFYVNRFDDVIDAKELPRLISKGYHFLDGPAKGYTLKDYIILNISPTIEHTIIPGKTYTLMRIPSVGKYNIYKMALISGHRTKAALRIAEEYDI